MQGTRVKLYLLASGLFDQPEEACSDFHFSLAAKLLHGAPTQWSFRSVLEALEWDLVEDAYIGPELSAEHGRLFGADGRRAAVPAHAAQWLRYDQSAAVGQLMSSHGMEFGQVPDHLICELEFMAYLVAEDPATRHVQCEFVVNHLAHWIPHFVQGVRSRAALPRYRLAAELLERLIRSEVLLLAQPLAEGQAVA